MATSIPSIIETVNLPPISTDEVINLTRALDIFQADALRNFAMSGIQSAKPILDRYTKISELAALVRSHVLENFIPISVARLDQTFKTREALKDFFNKDGPVLGENFADAKSTVTELTNGGIYINCLHEVPVLTEVDKKDDKTVIRTLSWMSVDALDNISNFPQADKADYPGSITHSNITKDAAGKVTNETRYTVFVDYANLRTTLDNLSGAIVQLQEMLVEVGTQISLELNFIKKASDEADKKQELSEIFKNDQVKIAEKIEAAAFEIAEAVFKLEQILVRERQLLMVKIEGQAEARNQAERMSRSSVKIPISQYESNVEAVFFNDRDGGARDLLHMSVEFDKNKYGNEELTEDTSVVKNNYLSKDDGKLLIIKSDSHLDDKASPSNNLQEGYDNYTGREGADFNRV